MAALFAPVQAELKPIEAELKLAVKQRARADKAVYEASERLLNITKTPTTPEELLLYLKVGPAGPACLEVP